MSFILANFLNAFKSKYIAIFFISFLPVTESKGALVFGAAAGLSPVKTALIALFASTVLIFLLIECFFPLFELVKKHKKFEKFSIYLERKREEKKAKFLKKKNVKNLKYFALVFSLFVFVALPLPGTGVYTGCLLASALNIKKSHCILAVGFANAVSIALGALAINGILVLI